MEGAVDPTKLVSQFLLRKTLVQVRRRILQCCRPGFPDNMVKAYRYQRVLWPMLVACRHVDPAEERPPVEREERVLPLWLARSLPVVYTSIRHYSNPSGSTPEAPPPHRSEGTRQSHLTLLRSASNSYSFLPGTRYPTRLPKNLDFKRIGFVLLQQPLPPPTSDSSPLSDRQVASCPPLTQALSPPRVLRRLLLSRTDSPAHIVKTSSVFVTTREQIRRHHQTLTNLRRCGQEAVTAPPPPEDPVPSQVEVLESEEEEEVEKEEDDEEEEESEVVLALSESSSSTGSIAPDNEEAESESEQELTAEDGGDESRERQVGPTEPEPSVCEQEDDDLREAEDYLLRVCDAVQACPGLPEQLLQVLDQFKATGVLETLYDRLSCVLQPWPQLLRDFAAFLTPGQARRCGLLLEQQLFQRSRRFLQRLGQNLGEGSTLYHQVVLVLQENSAPTPEDMEKISSMLKRHPDLQEEFWEFFQQLHEQPSPIATSSDTTETDLQASEQSETGSDRDEESGRPVDAKNISVTLSGEKVVIWTREADRAILTACQQRGASRKTFRHVSTMLGNKTAQQVSLRFQDLMKLFHSAFPGSTSRLSDRQEAALD